MNETDYTGVSRPPALAAVAGPPAPEAVRIRRAEAMLGIYFHTYKGREGFELPPKLDPLPAIVRPIGIDRAAAILGEREDHDILLRRRRAIATLVGTGRNKDDDFEPLVKSIYPSIPPDQLAALLEPGLIADSVYGLLGPADCVCSDVTHSVRRRPNYPLITDAEVSAVINKPVKPICDALDPQNWSKCSDFFANVYPALPTDNQYPGSGEYDAPKGPSPGNPGTPYQDVVFFEHFWMPWSGLSVCWFRNYLDIRTHGDQTDFTVAYALKRAIGSSVSIFKQDGGLDVDSGAMRIQAVGPGSTKVTMTKSVRFTDRTPLSTAPEGPLDYGEFLNYIAPFMLLAQLEEAVCDNICCN